MGDYSSSGLQGDVCGDHRQQGRCAQKVPGHNLGTSDLNQRLSWAPLASLGER